MFDIIERVIGHNERRKGAVILIIIGGLSIFSWTSGFFTWLDKGITTFPILTLRNLLAGLLILIGVGIYRNRII